MPMDKPTGSDMEALRQVMQALRDPQGGCPWDLEQDFKSIVPHTLEEAYEVAETIESGDMPELCDELGDLLFQVVFYAQMAEEQQLFQFEDITRAIVDKLIRRHPNVFGNEQVGSAAEQTQAWEQQKAKEREGKAETDFVGALAGVSAALPGLTRAAKLQRRAARVGLDLARQPGCLDGLIAQARVLQETQDSRSQEERESGLGDIFFTMVSLARQMDVDPERALRSANRRFETRFTDVEKQLAREGKEVRSISAGEWAFVWQSAKESASKD